MFLCLYISSYSILKEISTPTSKILLKPSKCKLVFLYLTRTKSRCGQQNKFNKCNTVKIKVNSNEYLSGNRLLTILRKSLPIHYFLTSAWNFRKMEKFAFLSVFWYMAIGCTHPCPIILKDDTLPSSKANGQELKGYRKFSPMQNIPSCFRASTLTSTPASVISPTAHATDTFPGILYKSFHSNNSLCVCLMEEWEEDYHGKHRVTALLSMTWGFWSLERSARHHD